MKVCLKGMKNFPVEGGENLVRAFAELLQTQMPLKNDIKIEFLEQRQGEMTTGVRFPDRIDVLSVGRLPIDVLRTLSHEWVHEFQHQKLGLSNNEKIQDIGGPEENMANALSGVLVKRFEKDHPEFENLLYGE